MPYFFSRTRPSLPRQHVGFKSRRGLREKKNSGGWEVLCAVFGRLLIRLKIWQTTRATRWSLWFRSKPWKEKTKKQTDIVFSLKKHHATLLFKLVLSGSHSPRLHPLHAAKKKKGMKQMVGETTIARFCTAWEQNKLMLRSWYSFLSFCFCLFVFVLPRKGFNNDWRTYVRFVSLHFPRQFVFLFYLFLAIWLLCAHLQMTKSAQAPAHIPLRSAQTERLGSL